MKKGNGKKDERPVNEQDLHLQRKVADVFQSREQNIATPDFASTMQKARRQVSERPARAFWPWWQKCGVAFVPALAAAAVIFLAQSGSLSPRNEMLPDGVAHKKTESEPLPEFLQVNVALAVPTDFLAQVPGDDMVSDIPKLYWGPNFKGAKQ